MNTGEEQQAITPQGPMENMEQTTASAATSAWSWVRFGLVAFVLMVFYIYNQHHANKALRSKEKLNKELKELHSEKISLESEITNASKQSEMAKKLESSGLKELRVPPTKIENHVETGKH